MKVNAFEQWLKKKLDNHKFYSYEQLPMESVLISKFKLSKMTIRKTINKYIQIGILFSRSRAGVFFSPFAYEIYNAGHYFKLHNASAKTIKTDTKLIPWDLFKYLPKGVKNVDFKSFVRFYYNKDKEIIAYSLNWIHKTDIPRDWLETKYTHVDDYFDADNIFNKFIMLATTPEDKKYLKTKESNIPAIFSLQTKKRKGYPSLLRLFRVSPDYFWAINFFLDLD